MSKDQPLFSEYLEFVDRRVFDAEYAEFWKRCVGGRHGIYVLFRRRRIYYVGIAADLWSRLRQHLKDRHGGRWDRISVYLTTNPARLRELESLLHHVLRPIFAGNKQVGRLSGTIDLLRPFMQAVKQEQDRKRKGLVGIPLLVRDKRRPAPKTAKIPAVAHYSRGLDCHLRGTRNQVTQHAELQRDGQIQFKGKLYWTPSAAAVAAIGGACNGWAYWTFERTPGNWVPLDELRRRQRAVGTSA